MRGYEKVGQARIIAVLEPRSNTMKLGTMKAVLAASLTDADIVCCYSANVDWDISQALVPIQSKSNVFADMHELIATIAKMAQPDDHILVMSNGSFGGIHQKFLML